jgi:TolB-like protein/Tfp pilus assembly protein PilF
MRLIAELKRRKVFQTAAIYAASAWVLLQVADLLLGMLAVPAWGLKLVFVVLLVGFPLAIVLSWMHQITPEGVKREVPLPEPSPAEVAPAAAVSDHSIAVLPFQNMSEDPANAHFADGLSEELLSLISRIPGLRVVGRTSSFSFRGRSVGAAEIARELRVSHLLDGSVRKAGQRLRITAQLVRGSDSSHVWSQTFDRDLSDIFAVQDEIAAAVAEQLEVKLLGRATPRSRQTDPDAYAHYLRGRHFFELASAATYPQAIAEFEAALAIDPKFAPAWATLGALHFSAANNSLIGYAEGSRRARAYSERALEIDPNLAEPMAMLGYFDLIEGVDHDGGWRRMQRAQELEPNNPRILTRLANIAARECRLDDALRYCRRALRADPLSPLVHAVHGNTCYFAGELEQAVASRRRVLELSPGWLSGHFYLGLILLARQDGPSALAEMQQEQSTFWRLAGLAVAHGVLGHTAESDAALAKFMQLDLGGAAYQLTMVHACRGEVDEAFHWLERAGATHDAGLNFARVDPLLARLRDDPRWPAFLARHGLTR